MKLAIILRSLLPILLFAHQVTSKRDKDSSDDGKVVGSNRPSTTATATTTGSSIRGCVMSYNTQACPALMANQTVVAGCAPDACYNFCGNRFIGCCAPDDIRCPGPCYAVNAAVQPTLTAGCRFANAGAAVASPPANTGNFNSASGGGTVVRPPVSSGSSVGGTCRRANEQCSVSSQCCSNRCQIGFCTAGGRVRERMLRRGDKDADLIDLIE